MLPLLWFHLCRKQQSRGLLSTCRRFCLSDAPAVCVCFCVFVCAAGCMRRSHRESIAHVLSACVSVSPRSSALTPLTRGLQLWAFIPILIIVICGVHCEGTQIFISLEKWRNITSPVSDLRVLFVLLRCFSFSAQHKILKLNWQTLELVMWDLHWLVSRKSVRQLVWWWLIWASAVLCKHIMLMPESALWEERRLRVHVSTQPPAATVSCERTNQLSHSWSKPVRSNLSNF